MTDQRSAEERLRAAGFVPSVGTGNPLMRTVYTREGVIGSFIEDAALSMLAREEAAEARGRAQGQREGREASANEARRLARHFDSCASKDASSRTSPYSYCADAAVQIAEAIDRLDAAERGEDDR